MKDFKKLIREAYLGNPLNEEKKPVQVNIAVVAGTDTVYSVKVEFEDGTTEKFRSEDEAEKKYDLSGVKREEFEMDVNEATDFNDPALMKARASQMKRNKETAKQAHLDRKYGKSFMDKLDAELDLKAELEDLNHERGMIMIDMEEEAEPEGGPIADRYGERLNQIDMRIADIQEELDDLRMYESVNEAAKKYFGVFRKGGNMGQGNEKLVYSFVDKAKAKQRAKELRDTLSPGEKSYYGMTYIVKPTDVEPESINEAKMSKERLEGLIWSLENEIKAWHPSSESKKKAMLDKLKKKLSKFESVNEDKYQKNKDSYIRVTEPRFIMDKNSPNFFIC